MRGVGIWSMGKVLGVVCGFKRIGMRGRVAMGWVMRAEREWEGWNGLLGDGKQGCFWGGFYDPWANEFPLYCFGFLDDDGGVFGTGSFAWRFCCSRYERWAYSVGTSFPLVGYPYENAVNSWSWDAT